MSIEKIIPELIKEINSIDDLKSFIKFNVSDDFYTSDSKEILEFRFTCRSLNISFLNEKNLEFVNKKHIKKELFVSLIKNKETLINNKFTIDKNGINQIKQNDNQSELENFLLEPNLYKYYYLKDNRIKDKKFRENLIINQVLQRLNNNIQGVFNSDFIYPSTQNINSKTINFVYNNNELSGYYIQLTYNNDFLFNKINKFNKRQMLKAFNSTLNVIYSIYANLYSKVMIDDIDFETIIHEVNDDWMFDKIDIISLEMSILSDHFNEKFNDNNDKNKILMNEKRISFIQSKLESLQYLLYSCFLYFFNIPKKESNSMSFHELIAKYFIIENLDIEKNCIIVELFCKILDNYQYQDNNNIENFKNEGVKYDNFDKAYKNYFNKINLIRNFIYEIVKICDMYKDSICLNYIKQNLKNDYEMNNERNNTNRSLLDNKTALNMNLANINSLNKLLNKRICLDDYNINYKCNDYFNINNDFNIFFPPKISEKVKFNNFYWIKHYKDRFPQHDFNTFSKDTNNKTAPQNPYVNYSLCNSNYEVNNNVGFIKMAKENIISIYFLGKNSVDDIASLTSMEKSNVIERNLRYEKINKLKIPENLIFPSFTNEYNNLSNDELVRVLNYYNNVYSLKNQLNSNKFLSIDILIIIASLKLKLNMLDEAFNDYKICKELNIKYSTFSFPIYYGIGVYYELKYLNSKDISLLENSLENYKTAIDVCLLIEDKRSQIWISLIYYRMGNVYEKIGKIKDAKNSLRLSFNILNKYEVDEQNESNSDNNIDNKYILDHLDLSKAIIIFSLVQIIENEGLLSDAISLYLKCIELIEYCSIKDYELLGTCYNNLGLIKFKIGNLDESVDYFNKSIFYRNTLIELHKKTSKKELASTHNNLGSVYFKLGNYKLSLINLNKALELLDYFNNDDININTKLALIKKYSNTFKDSLKIIKDHDLLLNELCKLKENIIQPDITVLKTLSPNIDSLSIFNFNFPNKFVEDEFLRENNSLLYEISSILSNLGLAYVKLNNFNAGLKLFFESLHSKMIIIKDTHELIGIIINLASTLSNIKAENDSIKFLKLSLSLYYIASNFAINYNENGRNSKELVLIYLNIANCYKKLNMLDECYQYAKMCLELGLKVFGDQSNNNSLISNCYMCLSDYYKLIGDIINSKAYLDKANNILENKFKLNQAMNSNMNPEYSENTTSNKKKIDNSTKRIIKSTSQKVIKSKIFSDYNFNVDNEIESENKNKRLVDDITNVNNKEKTNSYLKENNKDDIKTDLHDSIIYDTKFDEYLFKLKNSTNLNDNKEKTKISKRPSLKDMINKEFE